MQGGVWWDFFQLDTFKIWLVSPNLPNQTCLGVEETNLEIHNRTKVVK